MIVTNDNSDLFMLKPCYTVLPAWAGDALKYVISLF